MSRTRSFVLPPSILDLAFTLMIVVLLALCVSLVNLRQEYQTSVNLLRKRTLQQESGAGPDTLSLAINAKKDGGFQLVLESKKLGVKEFHAVSNVFKEIQRIAPKELLLRVDQEAKFGIPQQIMIFAHQHRIDLAFSYQKEG